MDVEIPHQTACVGKSTYNECGLSEPNVHSMRKVHIYSMWTFQHMPFDAEFPHPLKDFFESVNPRSAGWMGLLAVISELHRQHGYEKNRA